MKNVATPSYPPPYVKYKVYEYALWGTLAMNGLIDFERERERDWSVI